MQKMIQNIDARFDARFFKALCEPSRISILLQLAERGKPGTVTEISKRSPVNLSVVSRHLTTLKNAGILYAEKRGKEVFYSIRFEELLQNLRSIIDAIETYQASHVLNANDRHHGVTVDNTKRINGAVSFSYPKEEIIRSYSDHYSESGIDGLPENIISEQRLKLRKRSARALFHAFGGELPVATGSIGSGDRVIDLDYDALDDLKLLARKVGHKGKVIGIEITDENVKNIRNELFDEGLTNVEIHKGIIEKLPLEASSVDYIVSNRLINLTSSMANVFAEIRRILKPGGTAFLADVIVEELPEWVLETPILRGSSIIGAIGEAEYITGLKHAGFEVVMERERLNCNPLEIYELLKGGVCGEQNDSPAFIRDERDSVVDSIIEAITGRILTIVFSARKPA